MNGLEIARLKQDFNYCIGRYKKAEEYFRTHTVKECMKCMKGFNSLINDLSRLRNRLPILLNRELTNEELENGFEEVNSIENS